MRVSQWTARTACALQAALRMSNQRFADKTGIARRTIVAWHEMPDRVPNSELQQILDTTLEQAPEAAKEHFARLVQEDEEVRPADGTEALKVAIAVVVKDSEVLLVCRRGDDGRGISWQFPAGVIKPGGSAERVAIRETLAETNVHCSVTRVIGTRLHPVTHVLCDYLLCEYLGGDAENVDEVENVSVAWVDRSKLTRFIPAERIYAAVLEALEIPE